MGTTAHQSSGHGLPGHLRARAGALIVVLLSGAGVPLFAQAQDGMVSGAGANEAASDRRDEAPPAQRGGAVVVPADAHAAAGQAEVPDGPGVELITGGNGADGAARIGRLPILE